MNNTLIICLMTGLLISSCTTNNTPDTDTETTTQTHTIDETDSLTETNTSDETDSLTATNTSDETDSQTNTNTSEETDSLTETNTSTSTQTNHSLMTYNEDLSLLDIQLADFINNISLLNENFISFESTEQLINQAIINASTSVGVEQSTINLITDNLLILGESEEQLLIKKTNIELAIPDIFEFDDTLQQEINLDEGLTESEKENISNQYSEISSQFELQLQQLNLIISDIETKVTTISDFQIELTQLNEQLQTITSQINANALLIESLTTQSENIILIPGEQGDAGIQGLQGETGERGDTGLSWSAGLQETIMSNIQIIDVDNPGLPGLHNYETQLYYLGLRQDALHEVLLLLKEMEIK